MALSIWWCASVMCCTTVAWQVTSLNAQYCWPRSGSPMVWCTVWLLAKSLELGPPGSVQRQRNSGFEQDGVLCFVFVVQGVWLGCNPTGL
jgi:hypothetical protein